MGSLRWVRAGFRSVFPDEGHSHANRCLARVARERETVLRDLGYLKQAASLPNAHVICGEGGTFIHLGWTTVSTFAPIERFPLATLAVARGTPFIDVRPVTDVIAFANLPRVARDGSDDSEPWGPGMSVSLTTYIDMVEALGARIINDPRPRQSI